MENKNYYLIKITSRLGDPLLFNEITRIAQNEYNCDGVEEFALEEARVDEILGERAYSGGDIPQKVLDEVEAVSLDLEIVCFKYYFYGESSDIDSDNFIKWVKRSYPALELEKSLEQWQDWNQQWRSHYKTLEVSSELRVVPEWMKEEEEYRNGDIYIYPGQGFGTGEHETTFLCLQLFEEIREKLPQNGVCLDFGCGSGILGIAAIAKSQMLVDFCDIDSEALDNCLQNLELNFSKNNLEGNSLILRDRFSSDRDYDLVFANILENILILEKPLILEGIKKGAYLIVSGLLNDQVENIKNQYSELNFVKSVSKGDWSAILFKRES